MKTVSVYLSLYLITVSFVSWRCEAAEKCEQAGKFADTSDSTCQNYTQCVYHSSTGEYRSYTYKCPTTSVFNPNTARCTSPDLYKCGSDSTSDSTSSTTSTSSSTPSSSSSTSTTSEPPTNSNCSKAGRFPVADSNCKNYTLCVYDYSTSEYVAYNYVCPTTSVFNPDAGKCTSSSNYECSTDTTSTTEPSVTSLSTSAPQECKKAGRFPVESDSTCQKYTLCTYDNANSKFVQYEYKCPTTSVFNPNTAKCTSPSNYECKPGTTTPATTTDAPETTTPEATTSTETTTADTTTPTIEPTTTEATTPQPTVCAEDSFTQDPNSKDCTEYYVCIEGENPVAEKCPSPTTFNPETEDCEFDYVCPN